MASPAPVFTPFFHPVFIPGRQPRHEYQGAYKGHGVAKLDIWPPSHPLVSMLVCMAVIAALVAVSLRRLTRRHNPLLSTNG